ncbi:hypothetical protein MMC29_001512 [Sticta canariensis]|nr:hypothetical protein [Sticta canariensis]
MAVEAMTSRKAKLVTCTSTCGGMHSSKHAVHGQAAGLQAGHGMRDSLTALQCLRAQGRLSRWQHLGEEEEVDAHSGVQEHGGQEGVQQQVCRPDAQPDGQAVAKAAHVEGEGHRLAQRACSAATVSAAWRERIRACAM